MERRGKNRATFRRFIPERREQLRFDVRTRHVHCERFVGGDPHAVTVLRTLHELHVADREVVSEPTENNDDDDGDETAHEM